MRRLVLICLVLLFATTYGHAQAKPFAGTWKVEAEVFGSAMTEVCTLHAEGAKLKGTCVMDDKSQADIVGEIDGAKISYKHMAQLVGNDFAISYDGTVTGDGNYSGNMGIDAAGVTAPFKATRIEDKK